GPWAAGAGRDGAAREERATTPDGATTSAWRAPAQAPSARAAPLTPLLLPRAAPAAPRPAPAPPRRAAPPAPPRPLRQSRSHRRPRYQAATPQSAPPPAAPAPAPPGVQTSRAAPPPPAAHRRAATAWTVAWRPPPA